MEEATARAAEEETEGRAALAGRFFFCMTVLTAAKPVRRVLCRSYTMSEEERTVAIQQFCETDKERSDSEWDMFMQLMDDSEHADDE